MINQRHILAALFAAAVLPTQAASDLTNPLNTYVGTSQSTTPDQPAFLADTGLEVSFVWAGGAGAYERIDFFAVDPAPPVGDFPGAEFGATRDGTDGRNYLRTVGTDYHMKNFTAYVTVKRSNANSSVFLGLGTGNRAFYGNSPDRGTNNACAFVELQDGYPNASRRVTGNGIDTEVGYQGMTFTTSNALRMKMDYNSTTQQVTYTLDYDYNGVFEAQQTLPTFSVATQAAEWYAGDRASIFFGGDRSVVFTDLVITTTAAPPPAPAGLQLVSVGSATVNLSWNAGIPGNTFAVYRSETSGVFTTPIASGLGTTTFTDTTVNNGTPYFYVITQTNANPSESAFSNQVTATPVAGALPPQGVAALNAGNNAVLVDWSDLVSPFDTYKVYRSTDGGTIFSPLASGLTASRYLDEAVTSGNTYIYKVTSVLSGNESADSATSQAVPQPLQVFVDFNGAATNADPGVLGTALGTSWNGVGGDASVANLKDSLNNPSSVGLSSPGSGTYGDGDGWNVGGNNTPGSQTLGQSYDLMGDYRFFFGKQTWTLNGLIPGRKYDLYLYGYGNNLGQNSGFQVGGIAKQTKDPQGLAALTEGRHYVTFTAEASLDGSVSIDLGNPGTVGLTDADVSDGVGIINGFQLVENTSAILQPLNLTATGTTDSVELSWDDVFGATTYKIYRSVTTASDYTLLPGSMPTIGTYSDTSAVPGTTYHYVVKALVGSVESFYSAEASGMREQSFFDADSDGLSDADEALIGTNPNDASDFFVATSSTVTPNAGNNDISFVINGAEGDYVIERSTTLLEGSWVEIAGSQVSWTWTNGVLDNLTLSAPALAPAPGGMEFFRAKGVTTPP